ncbi:hypothetical protein P3X46_009238 [Hevea brasiliensis]|uniref:CCAAT-binding factor domain-containing protein n=1 Tax=Hevea brasiliensis TaxID=3981 RepID=A0ABQ9ML81_HEVBR|nr:hypothetical protein P3X46_009238 [Hevea brasiliensis]
MELLKSEVASFAPSLGLSSFLPFSSSGFNDADFRKSGPLKKPNNDSESSPKTQLDKSSKKARDFKNKDSQSHNNEIRSHFDQKPKQKPVPKPPYKNLPKLPLVKASALGVWHEDGMEFEKKVLGEGKSKLELKMGVEEWKGVVEKKKELGERLMWQYAQDYEQSRGQSADIKMLVTTQRSGTAADKVSAFSVLIGDNPIANLRSLDALLGMVTSKVGKRHALTGFEALKELFVSSLLPDRKLKTLLQRPVNSLPETKDGYSLLLFWYWEDCLKQRYERFVFALEEASRDMLPVLKDKALKIMYALLKSKSEQEHRLLSALVNKLGDPQNRGASNADFHLSNLLSDHPNMKAVVIDEVDSFLFRPHLGLRAKCHAVTSLIHVHVNFLSQIRLSHEGDGPKVAKHLIDVYFALFKLLITEAESSQKMDKVGKAKDRNTSNPVKKNKGESSSESHFELDSRILSAVLTGVNRAFPYVSSTEADDIIEVQTPMLFRLIRLQLFVHSKNFNVGVQALMLLDKISSKNQIVSDQFYRALYSKLFFPAAMNSSMASLTGAMKNDVNLKCASAFSKRLLQVSNFSHLNMHGVFLFLLSEVLKARPPLWNVVMQNESVNEDLENFEDIVEEADNESHMAAKAENELEFVHSEVSPAPSSDNDDSDEVEELLAEEGSKEFEESQPLSNCNGNQSQVFSTCSSLPGGCNPQHRDRLTSINADHASWWELMVLASHLHPSVATMAGTLPSGANIVYNGNPLNDLSLTAFLDEFMEKKPKQTTWHGGSKIEPAKKIKIVSLAEVDVPPEDFVFHKFYMNKMNSTKPKKKKKKQAAEEEAAEELSDVGDGDEVGGADESDNEEIENKLDSANLSFDADEDDDNLIGNASDVEMDVPSDFAMGADSDGIAEGGNTDDVVAAVDTWDLDAGNYNEDELDNKKRKRKSGGKVAASPFASLEDYEHLINEENPSEKKSMKKKKPKTQKKRRSSD